MASDAQIDLALIRRMVEARLESQLEGVSRIGVLHFGEAAQPAEPTDADGDADVTRPWLWVRVMGYAFAPDARHRGEDQPHTGSFTMTLELLVTEEASEDTSLWIDHLASRVLAAMEEYEHIDAGTGHYARLGMPVVSIMDEINAAGELRVGTIAFSEGTARRQAGTSFITPGA